MLYRYLYRSMFKPIIFGISGCTFIILIDALSEMIENIIVRNVPFAQVMELLSYQMIHLLSFTIPMGAIIGALVAYGNLSNDNELVALNALGVSLRNILKPILAVGSILAFLLLCLNQFIAPLAGEKQNNIARNLAYDRPSLGLGARQFIDSIKGYAMYLDTFDSKVDEAGNFLLFSNESNSIFASIINGKSVKWDNGNMVMKDSKMYEIDNTGKKKAYIEFREQSIPIRSKITGFDLFGVQDEENQMSIFSLIMTIFNRKKQGLETIRYELALQTKLSLSFSPIVMALLGALLAAGAHKRFRKGDGKLSGIAILFIYWVWIMTSRGVIINNNYSALIMWGPNVLFLLLALAMYLYKRRM